MKDFGDPIPIFENGQGRVTARLRDRQVLLQVDETDGDDEGTAVLVLSRAELQALTTQLVLLIEADAATTAAR